MKIQKASWTNSDNNLNISFPITKVNKEKRTVSGFATLDNVDRHGDVVTAEASEKAFERFRGNLREMHAPIAVGKVLSFQPEDYFDKESGKTYKGIYVNAYVSKGAQDTWEKVLDGTMTGFSIGGSINKSDTEVDPETSKNRRVIKEYDLMELSLVDSPANPLASIFSFQKNIDGTYTMKGIAADTQTENVFWCALDKIATTTKSDSKSCVVCDSRMEQIGWIESSSTEKAVSMKKVIDEYLKKDDAPGPDHAATTRDGDAGVVDSNTTINLYPDQNEKIKKSESLKDSENAMNEGGIKMADETTDAVAPEVTAEEVEAVDTVVETAEVPAEAAPAEEAVEKSVNGAESDDSFAKMLTDLRDLFGDALQKNSAESAEAIAKSVDTVDAARAEMTNAVSGISKEIEGLKNNISDFFKRIDELEKRLAAYESDTAIKKSSGDVDNSSKDTKLTKSIWQGSFLGVQNL
jgi:phage shock protein A